MRYFKNKEVTIDYRCKKTRNQSHLQGIERSIKEGESSNYQMDEGRDWRLICYSTNGER
jgi:hypothetical protein